MSTSTASVYRRVLRRETHSPRSGLAITVAVVLILVAAWLGTESVLELIGRPALLVAPGDMLGSALTVSDAVPVAFLVAAGVVVAVVGVLVIVVSLKPGRRGRHTGPTDRTALVVDDRAIASSLARTAAHAADLDPDQVIVTIGKRTADVHVRPSSGLPVDREAIVEAVTDEVERYELSPSLKTRIDIDKKGVVGK
ncbi:hypothetical protein GCM10025867_36110 [Frondihabitans sucicola]|uniref:DNA/RNA endonuclease G n=1 Tax=Frondihabitans sucicola TaxID=1268041 RepID=A0ABN6Y225_9MICO|nr:DUF6286 domain-containing protein [Frondihabitans sucicola]BDZ51370.1 hypothetical protein GCM10025867_36110 [Frondihabitans sucicola]